MKAELHFSEALSIESQITQGKVKFIFACLNNCQCTLSTSPFELLAVHGEHLEAAGGEVVALRKVHRVEEPVGNKDRLDKGVGDHLAACQVQDPQRAGVLCHDLFRKKE